MSALIYSTIMSADGYVADERGTFDWAAPDEGVHAFVNELERAIGTYLYGRRMYETMRYWETAHSVTGQSAAAADYTRIWQRAEKILYSRTLATPVTARTRIVPSFEPDAVRQLKADSTGDLSVGGPTLAAQALHAGLVDRLHLIVVPTLVGGGTRALPEGLQCQLELLDARHFDSGFAHLHYRVR